MSKHNVLYLVPDIYGAPGGIAKYCQMVARALTESGFSVSVISLHDQRASLGVQDNPKDLTYFPCHGNRSLFIFRAMVAIRTRPGIILIGHPHFGPLGWILARISRVPMFTFMYGIDVWSTLPLLRRSALRRSDRAIAISQFTATNAITANALSPNKLRILGNCLDPQFEQPAKQDTNTTTLSLLTVARILTSEQYKGHEQVIRTMPFLLERFPELIYNIVGDGDGRSQMEDVARQEGVEHAVKFHGSVSDTELKKHYREATLFVMPSRREGFGFVFLEAMAHGLPIVAGDQDATTEVVQDGKTGILVNPLSTYALHAAITRLLTQAEERRQMGLRGAEAVDSFSYPAFRATMTSYINEVLR